MACVQDSYDSLNCISIRVSVGYSCMSKFLFESYCHKYTKRHTHHDTHLMPSHSQGHWNTMAANTQNGVVAQGRAGGQRQRYVVVDLFLIVNLLCRAGSHTTS